MPDQANLPTSALAVPSLSKDSDPSTFAYRCVIRTDETQPQTVYLPEAGLLDAVHGRLGKHFDRTRRAATVEQLNAVSETEVTVGSHRSKVLSRNWPNPMPA